MSTPADAAQPRSPVPGTPVPGSTADLVDAKTAAALLGVKLQTLYAYVSRGLISAAPSNGKRGSLYKRADVEALRGGRPAMAQPAAPHGGDAQDYLTRWSTGTTLATAVTSISAEGPRYRGKLATVLVSRRRSFEDCVDLLWSGMLPDEAMPWDAPLLPPPFLATIEGVYPLARGSCSRQLLSLLAGSYAAAIGRKPETALGAPILAGRQMLQILAPGLGFLRRTPRYQPIDRPMPIARVIARSAGIVASEDALHAINACLILSADHELAPSTFAARVAASAAADLFSCVISGLGTFEGPMTGLGCDEPERLLKAARTPAEYVATLREAMARQEPVLGYNHPVYPAGDPRALLLLQLARDLDGGDGAALRLACIDAATAELQLAPSLAVGLIAVSSALRLPGEAAGMLMALGRVSGWIAHILEQRLTRTLILPRTRYIGAGE